MQNSILIIEDDIAFGSLLVRFLEKNGWKTNLVSYARDVEKALKENTYSIVLSDYRLPDGDGIDLIKTYKSIQPKTPVIIMTSYNDVKLAVKALKEGAVDYVTKPILPDELLLLLNNYVHYKVDLPVAHTKEKQSKEKLKDVSNNYVSGSTSLMKELETQMKLVAPTDYAVLILGESGTGKEWVASKIHEMSKRAHKPFIPVDCGALNNELAAGEFFGHIKGAYTGAFYDKAGIFEVADGGTVFLDEIGNLSYENQIKLLRVLQEKKVRRLGSEKEIVVDVRIIAATNENLKSSTDTGRFREDLYHRLNEFTLKIPPLRDRDKDIERYIEFFTEKTCEELGKDSVSFTEEAMALLLKYQWPGNLRELKNVIKKCVLISPDSTIQAYILPTEIRISEASTNMQLSRSKLKHGALEAEREQIIEALEQCHYNKSVTAKMLGVDRKTLYNKIKLLGLEKLISNRN